jgi:hypothetical protein
VNVGAFWNAVGFKQITVGGKALWAVELAPGARARIGQAKRQYHALRTGKQLQPDGKPAANLGTPFKPRAQWQGEQSRMAKPVKRLITTQANWDTLRTYLLGSKPAVAFGTVDFKTEVLLVVSGGNSWNCSGYSVEAAYESSLPKVGTPKAGAPGAKPGTPARVLVRMRRHTYQTDGGGNKTRPFGVFVLPRRPGKAYVLKHNAQGLIRGPALWREIYRTRIGKPGAELGNLPPLATKTHRGSDR